MFRQKITPANIKKAITWGCEKQESVEFVDLEFGDLLHLEPQQTDI